MVSAIEKLIFLLMVLCLTPSAFALPKPDSWWVSAGTSGFWFNQPETGSIYMGGTEPPVADLYLPKSTNPTYALNFGIGYDFKTFVKYPASYRLGLLYQYVNSTNTHGDVKNADEVDYLYNYQLDIQALFFHAELDIMPSLWLNPYIDVGIGPAFHTISNYKESTLPDQNIRISPSFMNNKVNNFAYRLGIGTSYTFKFGNKQCRMSLAYIYANYGTGSSGTSSYYHIKDQHLSQQVESNQVEANLRVYLG